MVAFRTLRWCGALAFLALLPAAQTAPTLPGTLHYDAHWRLLPAGEASLTWSRQGSLRRIVFTADSNGLVSLFYPVHDRMQSDYDPNSFCTAEVDNDTLEGRRRRQTRIQYQPQQHQLILDETDPSRQPTPANAKHQVKPIPGCVLDLFAALDYARAQPLRLGDVYNFPVNEGGDTREVRLTVDLKETVTTLAGSFSTVRVEPDVYNHATFQHPGKLWIWFSDDPRHLPVQIEARAGWGTLIAQLVP